MWPQCPSKRWRGRSCWLHPRESDAGLNQGLSGVITSLTLHMVPSWCRVCQRLLKRDYCPASLPRGKAGMKMNEMRTCTLFWKNWSWRSARCTFFVKQRDKKRKISAILYTSGSHTVRRAARDSQVCRGTFWNFWKQPIRIAIRHAGKHVNAHYPLDQGCTTFCYCRPHYFYLYEVRLPMSSSYIYELRLIKA